MQSLQKWNLLKINSDAENLQPQQDKLTPLSKPMGEGGEQLKPKEGQIYLSIALQAGCQTWFH